MDLLVYDLIEENENRAYNKISGLSDISSTPKEYGRIEIFLVRKESPYSDLFTKHILVSSVEPEGSPFAHSSWRLETGHYVVVPTLDTLYTLKMAHRFRKQYPHFRKTIYDIKLMRSLGAKIVDEKWFKALEKWNYNYNVPKLKGVTKNAFFSAGKIEFKYDHDEIHEAVKIGPVPAYTLYKKDGQEVECSKELFDSLPYETRLNGVMEEAMVLALERCLIPYNGNYFEPNPRDAYAKALEKVCTSITSGWFREFAWENYFQALNAYPVDFNEKFRKAVRAGKVKKLPNIPNGKPK